MYPNCKTGEIFETKWELELDLFMNFPNYVQKSRKPYNLSFQDVGVSDYDFID